MSRERIIETIHKHAAELRARGVKSLVLFGPIARGEPSASGDVDLILELYPPLTFDHYLHVKEYLQRVVGQPVELTMVNPRQPEVWPWIQEDAIEILKDAPLTRF